MSPTLTIVIPVFNEAESLPELAAGIREVCEAQGYPFDAVLVDDGSTDGSWEVIERLHGEDERFRGVRFRRNYGKSAALAVGFERAGGDYVITMDADLQDDPNEIPNLVAKLEEGYDLVSGWKRKRNDPLSKTIPSRFFNRITRSISGIPLHDFNCGLKIYRREVIENVTLYGELHRYIPLLAKWEGYTRIGELPVQHHARKYGTTKFGLERFVRGFLDLITVQYLTRYAARPMHFFGVLGTLSFLVGTGISAYLTVLKLFGQPLSNRPLLFLGMLLILLGAQCFFTGLLGEMFIQPRMEDTTRYQVKAEVGQEEIYDV
ncbi:MAG: glycosyltransferase family 2 protein [Bacteroidota bacterium]